MPRRWVTEDVEQPWTVGEALGVAMGTLRERGASLAASFLPFVLLPILLAVALGFMLHATGELAVLSGPFAKTRSPFSHPIPISPWFPARLGILALFTLLSLQVGQTLVYEKALAAIRKEPVTRGSLGRAFKRMPRIVGFHILYFLFAALTPFAILAAPFALTPFFIVDQDLPLISSLRKSWRVSRHTVGRIWLSLFALAPVLLIGHLSLILLPLAVPFYAFGIAYAYVRSTGRNDLPFIEPTGSNPIRTYLKIVATWLVVAFAGLAWWVRSLPTLRGAAWNPQDMTVRASAILSGVGAVVVLLALLLPYVLDRLEGRRFTSFVAARHVRSQKSGFLTVISILSICGVAISSCALSSVVSVMGGFSQDLKRKILGNNAHIVVDTVAGTSFGDYESAVDRVRAVPGVTGAAPVVRSEVMVSSASNLAGVIVSGIEPKSITKVIELGNNIEVGKLDYLEHPEKLMHLPPGEVIGMGPGGEPYFRGPELGLPDDIDPDVRAVLLEKPDRPSIILGRELAKTLHVYVGDEVTLVSPLGDLGPMGIMPRTKRFRVAAIFYSNMYEYDATYVYMMIDVAQEYFQTEGKINAIEIKVEDADRADRIVPAVVGALGRDDLRVRGWPEINKNLFSALKLEKFVAFIILSIAILVASFCIISTLLLMVTEKGKEIAILKAIGASDSAILRTFMIEGMIIGAIGTVFGVVTGLAVCKGLSWFDFRLDPDVYYIDRLPISVNGWDFLAVALAAFTICTLSTLYPAYEASRLRPVDGLRYE
ncbi:MAG: ABC transporter permease [Polyangiaceae bacterium]|nr:ABC transporter permease [Polyangiaceae bacterium]